MNHVTKAATLAFIPFLALAQAREQKGDQRQEFLFGGIQRAYLLHLPPPRNIAERLPLVVVLHGHGGTGEGMVRLTRGEFDTLADSDFAVVVYPDGVDKSWNDGRRSRAEKNIDDAGFLSALIDTLIRERNVDPHRVYVTGMSNGAMMTYRLGCLLAGRLAAIAPVDGAIPEKTAGACTPQAPLAVLVINNTEDHLVHWEGSEVTGPYGMRKLGKVLSVRRSVDFWVSHNACSSRPIVTEEPDRDPSDGTRVRRELFTGGRSGTEVVLYAVQGGGHTWPGGRQYLPVLIVGKTSRDMDACRVIWSFFMRHQREG